jgi:hypothetical protein
MLIGPFALLSPEHPAIAAERPVTLQAGGGVRLFDPELGFDASPCAGLRLGLGVTNHVSFALDYVFSAPARLSTDRIAYISALRGLARIDFLSGATRPYAIAGVGGVLMNFGDARDYSTGTLTGGLGISRLLGSHHVLAIEGTGDVYATRIEYFDLVGQPLYKGPRTHQAMGTISANLGFRF